MYASLNGVIEDSEKILISAVGEGFTYGYGLFETIKIKDSKVIYFKEHLERLNNGCTILGMPLIYDFEGINNDISTLIKVNNLENGSVKINYSKNKNHYDVLITTDINKYTTEKYESGYHICFASVKKSSNLRLVNIKSNNYLENILERKDANQKGFDEAIFFNVYDIICEGTYTNLFFVKNNIVYTPSESCGILPGIMREKVIRFMHKNSIKLEIGEFAKMDLLNSDEIFLTNSLMEIMPVSKLNEKNYSLDNNKITKKLRQVMI